MLNDIYDQASYWLEITHYFLKKHIKKINFYYIADHDYFNNNKSETIENFYDVHPNGYKVDFHKSITTVFDNKKHNDLNKGYILIKDMKHIFEMGAEVYLIDMIIYYDKFNKKNLTSLMNRLLDDWQNNRIIHFWGKSYRFKKTNLQLKEVCEVIKKYLEEYPNTEIPLKYNAWDYREINLIGVIFELYRRGVIEHISQIRFPNSDFFTMKKKLSGDFIFTVDIDEEKFENLLNSFDDDNFGKAKDNKFLIINKTKPVSRFVPFVPSEEEPDAVNEFVKEGIENKKIESIYFEEDCDYGYLKPNHGKTFKVKKDCNQFGFIKYFWGDSIKINDKREWQEVFKNIFKTEPREKPKELLKKDWNKIYYLCRDVNKKSEELWNKKIVELKNKEVQKFI